MSWLKTAERVSLSVTLTAGDEGGTTGSALASDIGEEAIGRQLRTVRRGEQ